MHDKGRIVQTFRGKDGVPHRYVLTTFRIDTRWPDGSPARCVFVPPNATVEISGEEQFMSAFIPEVMVDKPGVP